MSSGGGALFSFDLGNLFAGLGAEGAGGTAECGSRPSCFWDGKVCREKMEAYDACIHANLEGQNRIKATEAQSVANRNRIITFAIVGVGLFLVIRRFF